ncbi:MAG: hypothetical protein ACAH59_07700 [Pseudobdellovibrionaceae bacterium]
MGLASYLFQLANVQCEKCQIQLKLEDVQGNESLVCHSCGHTMPFRHEHGLRMIVDRSLVRPSPQVHIERKGSIFIIEKKWKSPRSRFLFIATAFCGILALIEVLFLNRQDLLLGLCVLGLFTIPLVVLSLQHIFNSTTIMIKNNKMVVGSGPLSLGGIQIFNVSDIDHFGVWRATPGAEPKAPRFAFGLDLTLKDGSVKKICRASDLSEAIYIEKCLEEILHIEETPKIDPDHLAV